MSTDEPTPKESTATDASTHNQTAGRDDYTRFHHDILVALAGFETGYYDGRHSEAHGLAIKRALEARYDSVVNHGRLYPNLDMLVERGLIDKSEADRRTNCYELTDAGWEFLRRRAQWVQGCIGTSDTLSDAAVANAARRFDTVSEVANDLDVTTGQARTLLVRTENYGKVSEGGQR